MPEPRYKHTRWRTVTTTKMKVERLNGAPQLSWKVDYGKKNDKLTPSYDSVSEHIRKRVKIDYYLMDEADRKAVKFMTDTFRENWEARCYESMGTIVNFTKTLYEVMDNKKEKFYLRTIPPLFSDGKHRVLGEDVGYMLMAMRAGKIIDTEDPSFDDVVSNLISVRDHAYCSLSLDYIFKLFEMIDFDKSVITLVDDPVILCGRKMIYQKGGHFAIRSSRMKPIISIPQGTLFLVHSLVCGVNWKKVPREDRDKIAAAIRKVSSIDQQNFVEYSYVISIIIEEKKRFENLYSNKPPDYIFPDADPKDQVPIEYYTQVVKEFELMEFENNYKQFGVYVLRVLFVLGWIVNFTEGRGYRRLAEMVVDEVMNYVPETNQIAYRVQIMELIRETSDKKINAHAQNNPVQNGKGSTITNGESNSGIVNIEISDDAIPEDAESCVHCEKIQNQFWDVQNQLTSFQKKRVHYVQERESYNLLVDRIHEQQEEIKDLQSKLDALEKVKPVIHSRSYATECRKLEAENQKLTDRIKFFDNTSSESQRGMNTIAKQNEQDSQSSISVSNSVCSNVQMSVSPRSPPIMTQAINANLEKQIAELEKQSSHLSEFSTRIVGLQTKDQDRIIAELEESIKNLQIQADRQEEVIKNLDQKSEPKIA